MFLNKSNKSNTYLKDTCPYDKLYETYDPSWKNDPFVSVQYAVTRVPKNISYLNIDNKKGEISFTKVDDNDHQARKYVTIRNMDKKPDHVQQKIMEDVNVFNEKDPEKKAALLDSYVNKPKKIKRDTTQEDDSDDEADEISSNVTDGEIGSSGSSVNNDEDSSDDDDDKRTVVSVRSQKSNKSPTNNGWVNATHNGGKRRTSRRLRRTRTRKPSRRSTRRRRHQSIKRRRSTRRRSTRPCQ